MLVFIPKNLEKWWIHWYQTEPCEISKLFCKILSCRSI